MYKVGKQYFLDSYWWICTLETSAYAVIERIDRPSVWKMVRQ